MKDIMGSVPTHTDLLLYPFEVLTMLTSPENDLASTRESDVNQVFTGMMPTSYDPTRIAQHALKHWNALRTTQETAHREAFLILANWLLEHESPISKTTSCWPIPFAMPNYYAPGPWLSASTQGTAISVLIRAYQLTNDVAFLDTAHRAVRIFELDILDGGVSTPIGKNGVFFEAIAVYPAAHILKGHILALLGLYDYVYLTRDSNIEALLERGLNTLHMMIEEFDTGYWTLYDLLHKRLTSRSNHSLYIALLEALTNYSGCEQCASNAIRWKEYQQHLWNRIRYMATRQFANFCHDTLKPLLSNRTSQEVDSQNIKPYELVCVPITAFPVPGGMRGVLDGVSQAMDEQWKITYLTRVLGPGSEELDIVKFGSKGAHPWFFYGVWLYCIAGAIKLFKLLRKETDFNLILPQDGVSTGAFAALVGKMADKRVVCMDHGSVTLLNNAAYRAEQLKAQQSCSWTERMLAYIHWPSLRLLAQLATRYTDQFLVAGDEVEAVYRASLNVHISRIIRYSYVVNVDHFALPDSALRKHRRKQKDIEDEAIVITMINRLEPEKGLHFAIEGIKLAIEALPEEISRRLKILLAGDGSLRSQVIEDIQRYGLDQRCVLLGSVTPPDVISLLGITDIFLYSGTRGTNYSMAVLEAMASACAVIASVVPQSNAELLAEGRGMPITPADPTAISTAITHLCNDLSQCRQMGKLAREYIATHHNVQMLKRTLLRASFFAPPITIEAAESFTRRTESAQLR